MRLIYLLLAIACLVIQYPLWFGENGHQKLDQLKKELVEETEKAQALSARNQAMRAEIQDIQSGVQALEERARSELGMISDHEVLVQFADGANLSKHADLNANLVIPVPDSEQKTDKSE